MSRVTGGRVTNKEELLQIKSLRTIISELHDTLFEKVRQLSEDDKLAAYAMVRAYAITYKSQIAHLEEEYQALFVCKLEVPVRVEPTLIELQSIALPLG